MLPKIILGLGLFAALFAFLIFSCKIPVGSCKAGTGAKGDVVIWGTLPELGMNAVTQAFNPQAKTYAVRYQYVKEEEFNQRLLEALASGNGPDLIMAPYQTMLAQESRLYPFPIAEKTYKDIYVDGASVLYSGGAALALPLSVEPMVLFYNRTLLSKHSVLNPPEYWDELSSVTPALTLKQGNAFVESSIALGTPDVPYTKDIIMAIVSQLGQVPLIRSVSQTGDVYTTITVNDAITVGGDVLPLSTVNRYITQFGDSGQTTYTWNASRGNAADVFVAEKLAMYIGYSGELPTLRAQNPRAEFAMATLPQTRGYSTFSTGMRMYAIGTLKSSKNLGTALTVQSQFASSGVSPTIAATVGAIPAIRAYAATQGLDPVVAKSMLVARGWYDSHEKESTAYTTVMISDIINYRYGVSDASNIFVGRLRDLYAKKF